jgi:ABC-type Fe3+/spermidine/putrescine transport system ATPase subunit
VHTVFQNYALFPHLDVEGNVCFPLRVKGVPRSAWPQAVQKALSWVQLETFASRRVSELSGGERQRVALARALVDEPECVLLDEPLSALDPHLRGRTLELLQEIQDRLGATYLYVTHDREEALGAAHRIGIMRDGRLMQVGTPEDIYHRPNCVFVAGFAGPINWLEGSRSGTGSIRLDSGVEVACRPERLPAGDRITIGIRPENVRFTDNGLLRGEITHRRFSGATLVVQLRTDAHTSLTAQVGAQSNAPKIGDRVGITWHPVDQHIFMAEENGE